ncbi:MAG TPA: glycerol-3-phosphate acyltransferase [Candidatus Ozemobacteraceae bacterium]|nr:glycerol-3-phosphate acyltransferase [Candidatus Ozemobacteraceae bacterium]
MAYISLYFFAAFLVGSIPVGELICRLTGKGSLFVPGEWGPLRIGGVFEKLGRPLGLVVTLIDALKGWFVVWPLITIVFNDPNYHEYWYIVSGGGLAVVIGHCHSLFLGFRGGRGAATTSGVMFALMWQPTLAAMVVWGVCAYWALSTRPGTLISAGALPIFCLIWIWVFRPEDSLYLYVVAALAIWTVFEHRITLLRYLGLLPEQQLPIVLTPRATDSKGAASATQTSEPNPETEQKNS